MFPCTLFLGILISGLLLHISRDLHAKPLQNPQPVTIAAYGGDTGLLVYVAQDRKYFAENGLNVTIQDYEAGKLAVDALIAGKADVATAADFVFVTQKFNHPDLVTIGTIATGDVMGFVARRDRGIENYKDLKGKRIGVTRKSSGEFNLGLFLLSRGLLLKDVEIVDLNPCEIVKAMVEGRIDAAETWEPHIYEIKAALGDRALVLPNQLDHHFYFLLICKRQWLYKPHFETGPNHAPGAAFLPPSQRNTTHRLKEPAL